MKLALLGALTLGLIPTAHAQTVKLNPNLLYQYGTTPATLPTLGQVQAAQATASAALPATGGTATNVTIAGTPVISSVSAAPLKSGINPTTTITNGSTYSALTTDTNICVRQATPSAITITLPASPLHNQTYDITDCAQVAAADPISVVPATGTVMGQGSLLMNVNGEDITLKYVAGDWKIQ